MLDMTPPPKGKQMRIPKITYRTIMTKDTGIAVRLDLAQWQLAKDVVWYQRGSQIVNGEGTEMRVYLGIEFFALVNTKIFDYRRKV